MLFDLIEAFYLGKQLAQTAIVEAIPGMFNTAFAMIGSGDISLVITGVLMFLGIGMALVRGLWMMVAKVLGRSVLDSI